MNRREDLAALGRLSADQHRLLHRLLGGQLPAAGPGKPIIPTSNRDHVELSSAQRRLWFFDRLRPGSPLYNMAGVASLQGILDPGALKRALDEVVRRHEVLRSALRGDSEPWAVVNAPRPVTMELTDLSRLPDEDRATAAQDHLMAATLRPFDLSQDLLLRAALVRLTPDEHLLHLSMHHIAADGWSLGVLITELAALYDDFTHGRPSRLPELAVQYSDYAVWQRDRLRDPAHTGLLRNWTERLTGAAPLDLVTDRPRGWAESFAGEAIAFDVPAAVAGRIKRFADQERATPYMVLCAAFAALLYRWSGLQEDILLGCAVAGRNRMEIEPLIGFFVNMLPLRLDLRGAPSFRKLVAQAKDVCTDAYAWQDVPFERIVAALQPERDSGAHVPLVRHVLVLHNNPLPSPRLPGLEVTMLPLRTGTAKFELELELSPAPDGGLTGWIEYASDLFGQGTVCRMAAGLHQLLAGGLSQPDTPVNELDILTAADRDAVTRQWSGAGLATPGEVCLHHLFERAADDNPAALAVVHGATELTYADLEQRSNRLAHHLMALGVDIEDVVGICLPRSAGAIVAMLGVLKAGAAYLPLEPSHPPQRLARLAAGAGVRHVITASSAAAGDFTRAVIVSLDEQEAWSVSAGRPTVSVRPGNSASVRYTSGPTGPQAVVSEHMEVACQILWMQRTYQLKPGEPVLHQTPLGFGAARWEWLWPLTSGARIVVMDQGGHDDPAFLIREHKVTTCHFAHSALRAFLAAPTAADCAAVLRRLVCSGEEMPLELLNRVREILPGAVLHYHYGPTEVAVDVAAWTAPDDCVSSGILRAPIGSPIPGAHLYVLDEGLRPVPPCVPGELCVGGLSAGRGYLRGSSSTALRFVPDPFTPGRRLHRTGDRARWLPDGTLDLLGRPDCQATIKGQRIEPGEVEAALAEHPAVDRAVVIPYRDGPGDVQLAGYVSLSADAAAQPGLAMDLVGQWRAVFDTTYRAAAPADPSFDIAGWTDSYTGQPIPEIEMREWVTETVDRITALRPSRVLEIGCGTGLLLLRLAPGCERYVGTDISTAALTTLRSQLERLGIGGVELSRQPADDFSGWEAGSFDLVILNSVIQYFPDASYLVRVLRGALSMVRPGGRVFVGDVRNLLLLEELHCSILLERLPPNTPVETLRRRTRQQVAQEEELVVHPALFEAVAGPGAAAVFAKSSPYRNELTRFRYDVILTSGQPEPAAAGGWVPWPGDMAVPGAHAAGAFGWRGVPDERLRDSLRAVRLTHQAAIDATVHKLRCETADGEPDPAAEPAALAEAARGAGYQMFPHLNAEPGLLDVEFRPAGGRALERPPLPVPQPGARNWAVFANDPRRAARSRLAGAALREYAASLLPGPLLPASLTVLPDWPLRHDGTIDRSALPLPEGPRSALMAGLAAPRNETEHIVATVWREVLNLDRIGVLDDFFELGGHSLMAIQLIGRLQTIFDREISVGELLCSPTIASVAGLLDRPGSEARQFTPIRRAERRRDQPDTTSGPGGRPGK